MVSWTLTVGLALLAADGPPSMTETAADAVTLREGAVVLGQVGEPAPRGALAILVRRSWAEDKLADRAKRWQEAEAPICAEAQAAASGTARRLASRPGAKAEPRRPDRRLDRPASWPGWATAPSWLRSPLMVVRIGRSEVRGVVRRPKSSARMLRQGWLSGFTNVESMPLDDPEAGARRAGGSPSGATEPVAIDRLLPIPSETDAQLAHPPRGDRGDARPRPPLRRHPGHLLPRDRAG